LKLFCTCQGCFEFEKCSSCHALAVAHWEIAMQLCTVMQAVNGGCDWQVLECHHVTLRRKIRVLIVLLKAL
jgi:hypothetical protein